MCHWFQLWHTTIAIIPTKRTILESAAVPKLQPSLAASSSRCCAYLRTLPARPLDSLSLTSSPHYSPGNLHYFTLLWTMARVLAANAMLTFLLAIALAVSAISIPQGRTPLDTQLFTLRAKWYVRSAINVRCLLSTFTAQANRGTDATSQPFHRQVV